jgi:hypothetical protein
MQHRRTKAFHEFGGPLGAPSHQMLPGRQKPKTPFSRVACQEMVRDQEPDRRRHHGVEVDHLPCAVASAPGPQNFKERFPRTPHDTRPGLLHTRLCPIPDP